MKSLAVDTSSKVASVSICEYENILCEFFINVGFTHSQTVMSMVDSALSISGIDISEIDQFVVTIGPGSFTGLRIGISAVKGMAFALHKPCVGISTIETLAYNLLDFDGIICPVMDARCNQVYTALFRVNNGIISRITDDKPCCISDLRNEIEIYNDNIFLLGDGAILCYNYMKDYFDKRLKLINPGLRYQKASSANLAAKGYSQISVGDLIPSYLRVPQAEREFIKKSEHNIL